jgi:hypothetical protein
LVYLTLSRLRYRRANELERLGGRSGQRRDHARRFGPGWIKRVIAGINQFDARTTNFHETAANTFASMLIQAGERYEGDVALNPSGENLLSIGLIEAYTTVLNRGRNLSIDGLPPVDSDPLNNALLLAASRISDLYMLLGNEAFRRRGRSDDWISFSDSFAFGSLATAPLLLRTSSTRNSKRK